MILRVLTLFSYRLTSSANRRARCKNYFLTLLGFCIPLALLALLVLGAVSQELLEVALGREGMETLTLYLVSGFASQKICEGYR